MVLEDVVLQSSSFYQGLEGSFSSTNDITTIVVDNGWNFLIYKCFNTFVIYAS